MTTEEELEKTIVEMAKKHAERMASAREKLYERAGDDLLKSVLEEFAKTKRPANDGHGGGGSVPAIPR